MFGMIIDVYFFCFLILKVLCSNNEKKSTFPFSLMLKNPPLWMKNAN